MLLVVFLVVGVWIPIGKAVEALKLSSVGLLILKLEDFRVVNTIATLEATESHSLVYNVQPIIGDGWFLVFLDKKVRARLEFQDGNRRLVGAALLS